MNCDQDYWYSFLIKYAFIELIYVTKIDQLNKL